MTTEERTEKLTLALNKHKLALDMTNEIVLQYIFLGEEGAFIIDPDMIAQTLAEQRFLSNYCNVDYGIEKAKNQMVGIRVSRERWKERVKACILEQSGYEKFPETWPWMNDDTNLFFKTNKNISSLYFCKKKYRYHRRY